MPTVSIGLPVYNGENYLERSLETILSQSFDDFELIVSDNASTDSTRKICESYCKQDDRIQYNRSEKNMGAAWNFNRAFELSSGKYFKWAAHDDMLAADFLLRCVETMERDHSVVLCHSEIEIIDEQGRPIKNHPHGSANINQYLSNINCVEPHLRFADLIKYVHPCIDIFGLLRSEVLSQTSLIGSYIGSDRNLLVELGLLGRFHRVPECLFFSRMHEKRSIKIVNRISVTKWFDTSSRKRIVFHVWKNGFEYFKSVQKANLSFSQKLKCYSHLCKWVFTYRKRLSNDIKLAVKAISPEWFINIYRRIKSLKMKFE